MPLKRFLIAPEAEGLVNNLKPWIIPDNAYAQLDNAYIFRGRLKKRWGTRYIDNNDSQLESRLRIQIDTIVAGVAAGNVPGNIFQIGQQFSVGDTILTVVQAAGALDTTVAGENGTFNTVGGAYTFTIAVPDGTPIYYYPSTPVMGFATYDTSNINNETMVVFDQQFAYSYNPGLPGFQRLGTALWSGTNSNFVWGRMFANTNPDEDWLFTVNNMAFAAGVYSTVTTSDGIKYYDGTTWTNFAPLVRTAPNALRMTGARLALEFKGRMLFFAPYEALDTTYPGPPITLGASTQVDNRVRYSWQETLTDVDNCFFEASGKGGYIDAPTSESIITAQFVKDRLVVYFERSTYELVYTASPDQPFIWQKLDPSIGAEATFSQVPFDSYVLGIGTNGIYSCNGANVQRIDEKIPDEVFNISNLNNAFERIAGIRDYLEEMVYWTFPLDHANVFPQKLLIYNYKAHTWSFFDDTFTAFGYFNLLTGLMWQTWTTTWEESDWEWRYTDDVQRIRKIVAGNQQGFVVQVEHNQASNSPALSITDLVGNTITCINHNLSLNDYVEITDSTGSTNLNNTIVNVVGIPDNNTITIDGPAANPGYSGGGVLTRINNIQFKTKEFNFFTSTGQQTFVPYVDFLIDRTPSGQHVVDYELSSADRSMVADSEASGAIVGTNILETSPYALVEFEQYQDRLWHRVYFQAVGDTVQLHLYFNEEQLKDASISKVGFTLHALLIYAEAEGIRLGET